MDTYATALQIGAQKLEAMRQVSVGPRMMQDFRAIDEEYEQQLTTLFDTEEFDETKNELSFNGD